METSTSKIKKLIGRAENISFPEFDLEKIPARVDTGAKTSSIWASDIAEEDGILQFTLFGRSSQFHSGAVHRTVQFEKTVVASSIGEPQERYVVRILVRLKGKKIRARFTLADRSQQSYPVLVGRNVLRGKFVVDVQDGKPLYKEERQRSRALQSRLTRKD
jgi:hypothetical protein